MNRNFFIGLSLCAALLLSSGKCGGDTDNPAAEITLASLINASKGVLNKDAFTDIRNKFTAQQAGVGNQLTGSSLAAVNSLLTASETGLANLVSNLPPNANKNQIEAAQAALDGLFDGTDLGGQLKNAIPTTTTTTASTSVLGGVTEAERTALIEALKSLKTNLNLAHNKAPAPAAK